MNKNIIFSQLDEQLSYLQGLLKKLTLQQYTTPSKHLGGATIGGHSRHILELLECAVRGREAGLIDYENRERDLRLERDTFLALKKTEELKADVSNEDLALSQLHGGCKIASSYYRELVYNIEHTIHHLALIKVALVELGLNCEDENFGMAYATIKYRQKLQKS